MNHFSPHERRNPTTTTTTTTTTIIVLATIALLATLAVTVVGFTEKPVYAQLVKDHGASGFAPGEDPRGPGWMPNGAEEDAPGHLAESAPGSCIGCAKEFTPGHQGLEAGIIGPDLKK